MVMENGMSEKLGQIRYGSPEGEDFLGRDYSMHQVLSNEVAAAVDEDVRFLITQALDEARTILSTHEEALHRLGEALMDRETLNAEEVASVLHDVPKWEHAEDGTIRLKAPDSLGMVQGAYVAARTETQT